MAEYFLSLKGDDAKFRREWPVRANPLIYHFFSATLTKPEGDATAWCAASLNWFLLRARATDKEMIGKSPGSFSKAGKPFPPELIRDYSTFSASSGSFRCWSAVSGEPKKGDLIVLANKGTENLSQYCRGQGHVAIFIEWIDDDWVLGLGGNQSLQGSNGAVTLAKINTKGEQFLKFATPAKS